MWSMTYGEQMSGGWVVTVYRGEALAYMTGVHETLRGAVQDADRWMAGYTLISKNR